MHILVLKKYKFDTVWLFGFSVALILLSQYDCLIPQIPVNATHGAVWPKPIIHTTEDSYLALRPNVFQFKIENYDCDIIQDAIRRYYSIIFLNNGVDYELSRRQFVKSKDNSEQKFLNFSGYLDTMRIHLLSPCEQYPYEFMDEHYIMRINTDGFTQSGVLVSQSVWGILRGLETFSQVIKRIESYQFAVQTTSISDMPRFTHRGLLIDTSRHYLPVHIIMKILDGMAYSKLNVLHWHIVDDQSFPYRSSKFPSLSDKGAYDPILAIYTQADIKRVINHARLRGIRVIPEFDTPGHTLSWGAGIPGLLTTCSNIERDGQYGPIDPSHEDNYLFLENLFGEVTKLFPDEYLHLGGDEVDFGCWSDSPRIQQFMKQLGIEGNYTKLEEYYINRVIDISNKLQAKAIVWQEVFDNGVELNQSTVVHVWTGDQKQELYEITRNGHKAILSTCWYLDHLQSGGDWIDFYLCEPKLFNGTFSQKKLVIGGEACMWAEVVDETNIQQRIWPRACAMAEVLWSGASNITDAKQRIEEHTCRLKKRGIPSQPPNGPNYCPYFLL